MQGAHVEDVKKMVVQVSEAAADLGDALAVGAVEVVKSAVFHAHPAGDAPAFAVACEAFRPCRVPSPPLECLHSVFSLTGEWSIRVETRKVAERFAGPRG